MIGTLDRKLLRDLWRLKSQLVAIAAVMAVGVTVFVMFLGMIRSLDATRDAYYDRTRFADVFALAKRAPVAAAEPVRALPGVAAAETRIQARAVLDVAGFDEPVSAVVHSVPDRGRPLLNDLVLRGGRWLDPRRPGEVLLNEPFATAHGLRPGDRLVATLNGKRQTLTVAGTVLSPEYVYAIAPGRVIPDDLRFGVAWMSRRQLEAVFDLDGAFNSLALRLRRDAVAQDVLDGVDRALERWGGTGAFPRSDQTSERFLSNELDQLRTLVRILPVVFLTVAAFLLNMVLARLVATEREIIGLLKAFGYGDRQIALHYAKLAFVVVAAALAVGFGLGTWMGRGLAALYIDHFHFPFLHFRAGIGPYALTAAVTCLAGAVGVVAASRAAMRLEPAEAMRPPAPLDYARSAAGGMLNLRILDETTRMVLRHLLRHPQRSALTVLGIAMATGLLTGARGNIDAVEKMLFVTFERAELQDVTVTFVDPRELGVVHKLARLPGVTAVQPFRAVPAVLRAGTAERRQPLIAVRPGMEINRLVDSDGDRVGLPEQGVMLSAALADLLGVGPGETLLAEIKDGRRPTVELPVAGVFEAFVGSPAYADLNWLSARLDEAPSVTGAHLLADPAQMDALFHVLRGMPAVAGVELTEAAYRTFRETMDRNIGVMIVINTSFSSLIIFGVLYNAARISLSERGRELASMRVLGFSRAEVSFVLLTELAAVVLLALPLGAGFGALLSYTVTRSFSGDLIVMPFALQLETMATAAGITIVAAVLSGLLVRRRIDRLDLVGTLKTRE